MPALNYQKQFAELVEDSRKKQTIRALRKYPIRWQDRLYHYTGMRTKNCRKLGESIASVVSEITISETAVKVDGQVLYRESVLQLAKADGFNTVEDFMEYFSTNHGLPFRGQLIKWENIQ